MNFLTKRNDIEDRIIASIKQKEDPKPIFKHFTYPVTSIHK